jgi:hypothetical protein
VLALRRNIANQIEFQNAGNHDDGLRPIAIFKHREAESLRAVNEESTAGTFFVLDHPVTSAIAADFETRRIGAGPWRGRFRLDHDTSP